MTSILFIFLLLASLHAPSYASGCTNIVPGLRKMAHGVDVTKLDFFHDGGDTGYRSPVINLTCYLSGQWTSSSGVTYQKPDQVWYVTNEPWGLSEQSVNIYKSGSDIKEYLQTLVNADIAAKFWFSGSYFYKEMQHAINTASQFVAQAFAHQSAYSVGFFTPPTLNLGAVALEHLKNINGNYSQDPDGYKDFIHMFGTHYFSKSNLGGMMTATFRTTKCYFYRHGDQEARVNVQAGFRNLIETSGSSIHGKEKVSEEFTLSTTKELKYYGGNANLQHEKGIEEWQPTIEANPWLFSGTLRPISDLIVDQEKKASMEEAVEQYVLKSYLEEIQVTLEITKDQRTPAKQAKLHNELNALQSSLHLERVEVTALDDRVAGEDVVPPWFLKKTQLCFKWRPVQKGDKCGRGANSGRECAGVGQRTSGYVDVTGGGGNGCLMQWMIQNNAMQLPWFKQVQICIRWQPTGQPNQCGDGSDGTTCAKVNSFTEEYTDNTDRRYGGCQLSWMLQVPNRAPAWMHNVQLCFWFEPENGDNTLCGSESGSRELCSKANDWTEFYTDDTSTGTAGCKMLWGLKVPPEKTVGEVCTTVPPPSVRNSGPLLKIDPVALLLVPMLIKSYWLRWLRDHLR